MLAGVETDTGQVIGGRQIGAATRDTANAVRREGGLHPERVWAIEEHRHVCGASTIRLCAGMAVAVTTPMTVAYCRGRPSRLARLTRPRRSGRSAANALDAPTLLEIDAVLAPGDRQNTSAHWAAEQRRRLGQLDEAVLVDLAAVDSDRR